MENIRENLAEVKEQLRADDTRLKELTARLDEMDARLDRIGQNIQELLDAWKQGLGVARFVKFMAPVVGGIIAVVAWARNHLTIH